MSGTPKPTAACGAQGARRCCFRPDDERRDLFAEVTWSALHGLAVLADTGRIRPDGREERLVFLVTQIAGSPVGEEIAMGQRFKGSSPGARSLYG